MLGCVTAWCRMDWKGSCSPEMARHELHTADEVKDAQATETIGRVGLGEESRRPEVGKLRADDFMKALFSYFLPMPPGGCSLARAGSRPVLASFVV